MPAQVPWPRVCGSIIRPSSLRSGRTSFRARATFAPVRMRILSSDTSRRALARVSMMRGSDEASGSNCLGLAGVACGPESTSDSSRQNRDVEVGMQDPWRISLIRARSFLGLKGLVRKSFAPRENACSRSASCPLAVRMTTGVDLRCSSSRTWLSTSRPVAPGIMMSKRIRS